ncbi:oxidoreductase, putative [Bodo saltans]|uniref:Oxidoreductase, putative n=1 Tax=Bodo saltans TaxID=75058 RepID=A0A0S4JHD0_BODSA|nr:oxidoreductase, putative [Bodo saltans]|eukprot:CUG90890.1 oxidoreductase, putative [Bodo saltans]
MAATPQLLTPFAAAGGITYKNRIGLAPLTRARADAVTGCVKDMHVEYYGERASSGLIFSEGAGISRRGLGWYSAPGIYTAEQVEAWKPVTAAVHKNNGLIFCQLWHMGRAGHEVLDGVGFGFHEKTAVPYSLEKARAAIAAGNPDGTTALAGNAGYTVDAAETAIAEGRADIITFGRPYISNPDLAERVRDNVPLAADPPYAHWWGSDSVEGYLTYPRATVKANA